jgi:hypothetical protein
MIFHDYERMAPARRSTRPLNLENQLARARKADNQTELHSHRFSLAHDFLSGLFQAAAGRIKALQLYRVPRIKSDPDV